MQEEGRGLVARVLASGARWAWARPARAWALLVLPALALALVAWKTPKDLSFAGLMDRSHPEVARYFEASRAWGLGGRMPLLLEGPEADLDGAAQRVVEALDGREEVRSVRGEVPREWLARQSLWMADADTWTAWQALVANPADESAKDKIEAAAEAAKRSAKAVPGRRMLLVTLARDSFELDLDAQAFVQVEAATREAIDDPQIHARFAGMPAIVQQDQAATLGRMAWLSPLSLVLALGFLLRVESRLRGLLAIGGAMVVSALCTVALVGGFFGRITLMEALFGVIVFGLGVDFAVHLRLRADHERRSGHSEALAVERSFARTGPGVLAGAMTTAGAFAIAGFAPEPTFQHLGITGALGIVLCFVAMWLALPAAWSSLSERTREQGDGVEVAPRADDAGEGRAVTWVRRLAEHAARHPRAHLLVLLLALLAAGAGLPQLHYETDLRKIINPDLEALASADAIAQNFDVDPMPWVFAVDGLPQLRNLEAALKADPAFKRVESASRFFRADAKARGDWLREQRPKLRALSASSAEAAALFAPLLAAAQSGAPSFEDLPAALGEELRAPDGRWLVYAFSQDAHMDARQAARERGAARSHDGSATSMLVLFEVLNGTDRPWVWTVLGAVAIFVLVLLAADLRRVRWLLLALVPVSVGVVLSFGALAWFGVSMNTVTALAAPLVLGLGVDDGIHVVHRLRELGPGAEAEACAQVGRAIALTTATTCASFGTLVLSGHPGMSSLAWVMLLALPLCLLASVSTLTALAVLTRGQAGAD